MECRKELVEQYRKWILHHTNSRYRISENCNGTIELQTENYKKPRSQAPSPVLEPWYKAKSFSLCHEDKLTEELFSRDVVDRVKRGYEFLLPYYDYFVTLDGDPDPREL